VRLSIVIDSINHDIDSSDPELLGRWIMEIFGRLPVIYPSTQIRIQAWPSFVLTRLDPPEWGPDWVTDSRVLGQLRPVRSPRDVVAALTQQLDELDALREQEQGQGNGE
jgi:hypothetical protein